MMINFLHLNCFLAFIYQKLVLKPFPLYKDSNNNIIKQFYQEIRKYLTDSRTIKNHKFLQQRKVIEKKSFLP